MTYYYKTNRDTYHWHYMCSKVPAEVESISGWVVSKTRPKGREKCNECKSKDRPTK